MFVNACHTESLKWERNLSKFFENVYLVFWRCWQLPISPLFDRFLYRKNEILVFFCQIFQQRTFTCTYKITPEQFIKVRNFSLCTYVSFDKNSHIDLLFNIGATNKTELEHQFCTVSLESCVTKIKNCGSPLFHLQKQSKRRRL